MKTDSKKREKISKVKNDIFSVTIQKTKQFHLQKEKHRYKDSAKAIKNRSLYINYSSFYHRSVM